MVRVCAHALHAVIAELAVVDVAVVELELAVAVAQIVFPFTRVLVPGCIGVDTIAVALVIFEHALIPRPIGVCICSFPIHASLLEEAVKFRPICKKQTSLAFEAVIDKASLQPVPVAVHHGPPPVHDIVDPLSYEPLVHAALVVYRARPMLLVAAPLPMIRVARGTGKNT